MTGTGVRGCLVSLLVSFAAVVCFPAATLAQSQSAQAAQTEELQKKMQAMQQQMDELNKELQALKQQQQQQTQDVQKATVAANKASDSVVKTQSSFDKFMKGFFGTLDTSIDYT